MPIHFNSIKHLEKAKVLASSAKYDSLLYAALELRYAIECIFYRLIPLYKDELPTDMLKEWRPQKIIDEIIDCDPYVAHSNRIRLAFEDQNGTPKKWAEMGKQTGISKKVLREGYHRLGAFLHAPLNAQIHDFDKLQRSVNKAIEVVENYSGDSIMSNLAARHTFECICGRKITRNEEALSRNPIVKCPDVKCGAIYNYESSDDGAPTFRLVDEIFTCPECQTKNYIAAHLLRNGVYICCIECSKRWRLRTAFVAEPAETAMPEHKNNFS